MKASKQASQPVGPTMSKVLTKLEGTCLMAHLVDTVLHSFTEHADDNVQPGWIQGDSVLPS